MPLSRFFRDLEYNYTPARLKRHQKTGYVIVFDVVNPSTGKFVRVKRKVNELRKLYPIWAEFKSACDIAVNEYNTRLANGWTPWGQHHFAGISKMVQDTGKDFYLQGTVESDEKVSQSAVNHEESYLQSKSDRGQRGDSEGTSSPLMEREVVTVAECLKKWLTYKKNLRPDTLRSYNSIAKMLREWTGEKFPDIRMRDFTRAHANLFMEYLDETGLGARSYNNYLGNVRAFFSWSCSAEYCDYNPFDRIPDKQVEEKFRDVIPLEDLKKIRSYFDEKLPPFVTMMLLVYFGGMRPKEITRVRVNQIKLNNQGIEMPGYQTKTHAARVSPLSRELVERLADAIRCAQPTDYLIGQNWVPGPVPITTKAFQKRWDKMRKELGMPMEYQVYSLRDCSAFYRMESKDVTPLDTMKALGHKRIYQTLEYANHEVKDLAKRLESGTPSF